MQQEPKISEIEPLKVSPLGIYTIDFKDDVQNIVLKGSIYTGLESILVNGELVIKQYSFKRRKTYKFEIDQNKYELELNMVNLLSGEIHCTLSKNNKILKTIKKVWASKKNIDQETNQLVYFVCFGAVVGVSIVIIKNLF